MKILVTGGLGFIGSNFILKLLEQDKIEITNIDAEFFGANHKNLFHIKNLKNYNFVKGNISNKNWQKGFWKNNRYHRKGV